MSDVGNRVVQAQFHFLFHFHFQLQLQLEFQLWANNHFACRNELHKANAMRCHARCICAGTK